jgi:hypothetical protein
MAIVTKKVTVGPLPPPETITVFDSVNLYVGANITLIEKSGSGVWSCIDCKDIASLNYENGMVTGLTAGHATVTYTINKDEGITLEITNVIVNSPHEESITSPLNPGNIKLVPNPNKGDFIVTGSLNSDKDEEVTLEILDMFGQEVYNGKAVTVNGKLNERIILSNNLANGPYLINLSTVSERYIFHFVVEK